MYELELKTAVGVARLACRLCSRVQAELVTDDTMTKHDNSPVTIADLGAQAVISHMLRRSFPDDPLTAEENAAMLRDPVNAIVLQKVQKHVHGVVPELYGDALLGAIDRGNHPGGGKGRFWTVDPIDGTKGFIRGEQYAIAMALIEDGEVVVGVLGCPNLAPGALGDANGGVIYAATRGGGTWAYLPSGDPPSPVHVADVADTARGRLCESVEAKHTSHSRAVRIAGRLGITAASAQLDSQCKYAIVARGEATIYMRLPSLKTTYYEKIWDHAAGSLVVTEAGGRVTDINGKPLNFSLGRELHKNWGILATNGALHEAVLAAADAVYEEGRQAEAAKTDG